MGEICWRPGIFIRFTADEEKTIEKIKQDIKFVETSLEGTDRNKIAAQITKAAGYETIKKIIDDAPVKKFPRWFDMGDSYECSECGCEYKYPVIQCPNCHATMVNYGVQKNQNTYNKKEHANSYFEKMGFFQKADELTKLLLENPGVPLLFMAGEDANIGDYNTMTCSNISYELTEALDYDYGDRIYTDRDDFRDQFEEDNWDDWCENNKDLFEPDVPETVRDQKYQEYISEKIKKYDSLWKDCILVTVDN